MIPAGYRMPAWVLLAGELQQRRCRFFPTAYIPSQRSANVIDVVMKFHGILFPMPSLHPCQHP